MRPDRTKGERAAKRYLSEKGEPVIPKGEIAFVASILLLLAGLVLAYALLT